MINSNDIALDQLHFLYRIHRKITYYHRSVQLMAFPYAFKMNHMAHMTCSAKYSLQQSTTKWCTSLTIWSVSDSAELDCKIRWSSNVERSRVLQLPYSWPIDTAASANSWRRETTGRNDGKTEIFIPYSLRAMRKFCPDVTSDSLSCTCGTGWKMTSNTAMPNYNAISNLTRHTQFSQFQKVNYEYQHESFALNMMKTDCAATVYSANHTDQLSKNPTTVLLNKMQSKSDLILAHLMLPTCLISSANL